MSKTILIVDDHADSREMLRILLKIEGFNVIVAENGSEGIEKAMIARPDLIVTDLHMPTLSGIEMVKQMQQIPELHKIQVIVLSADLDKKAEAIQAGVDCFLTKPTVFEDFINSIKQLLKIS
jgi:CheY-like chemotaxis protein